MASLKRSVEMGGRKMNVRKVKTDFSWVFIQSVLKTFNLMNIKQYLFNCFDIIHRRKDREYLDNFTVVHLCSSHMIKDFGRYLYKLPPFSSNKRVKRFAMHCFARLQNCVSLSEAEALFKLMCTVFGSPRENKKLKAATKALEKKLKSFDEEIDDDPLTDRDESQLEKDYSFQFEGKNIKEVSPFTDIFTKILNESNCSDEDPTNDLYYPEMLNILTKVCFPLFPLWSGLMLQPLKYADEKSDVVSTRDTNAPVEGWFKAIKQDVSKTRHERPSKFIIKLRKTLKGRLKETAYPYIRKTGNMTADINKESDIGLRLKTEKWGKKRQKRTPTYHKTPKRRPVSVSLPQVPSWGGEVADRTLVNTCTIDNCLTILYLNYLEDVNFRELLTNGVFLVLHQCCQLMESGKFAEAKAHWLENIGTRLHKTTDIFGDEYDLFITHIQNTFVTKLTSKCNEPNCPEPYRESDWHGIMLR